MLHKVLQMLINAMAVRGNQIAIMSATVNSLLAMKHKL